MSIDNPLYWKHYYRLESNEDLQRRLVFTDSEYEKDKLTKELARREAEEVA